MRSKPMPRAPRRITAWLESAPPSVTAAYAIVFSFAAYFSMFAFRKPFAAGSYEGASFAGGSLQLKSALVIGQICGYGLAKIIGVKLLPETRRAARAPMLVATILAAWAALALFAVLPASLKPLAMFLNGMPLGMVWGLVVWYLEGRRSSEILLAGLSTSFIIASGAVKDVGRAVLAGDAIPLLGLTLPNPLPAIDENWMPAVVGALFLPSFLAAVYMLDRLPDPSPRDVAERSLRATMDHRQRMAFILRFLPGMALLVATYIFVTAFRDFRDNYAVDIFTELGYQYEQNRTIVSRAELLVGFGVAAVMALVYFVRDNARALMVVFGVMTAGLLLLGGGTWLHQRGQISGFTWMALAGLGSYLAYVPYNTVLFDRLIASTRTVGTAVFAIYVADSFGYVGSVSMLLTKDMWAAELSKAEFLQNFAYGLAAGGAVCLALSAVYFRRFTRRMTASAD
jgi:hypothetical protein